MSKENDYLKAIASYKNLQKAGELLRQKTGSISKLAGQSMSRLIEDYATTGLARIDIEVYKRDVLRHINELQTHLKTAEAMLSNEQFKGIETIDVQLDAFKDTKPDMALIENIYKPEKRITHRSGSVINSDDIE